MILSQRYDITASRNLRVYASLPFCLLALSIWSGLRVKAKMLKVIETSRKIIDINFILFGSVTRRLNTHGSLNARY